MGDPKHLSQSTIAIVGALAAVLGHMFPVYLRFRGGKGVASALGVILVLDPPVAGAALAIWGPLRTRAIDLWHAHRLEREATGGDES